MANPTQVDSGGDGFGDICDEVFNCANGVDDDADGRTDCADAECSGDPACPETGNCSDGVDSDSDGLTDCA